MGVISKIRFHYNSKFRVNFNRDLKRLFKLFESKTPFTELSSDEHIKLALNWLSHTNQLLNGKGFPTKFNVKYNYGLGPSYPETTGYTLCTLLSIMRNTTIPGIDYKNVSQLVINSYQYLKSIQFDNGAFTGGHAAMNNYGKPSVFNTAQILLGFCDLYESLAEENKMNKDFFSNIDKEDLRQRITKAANFLNDEIEEDGSFNTRYSYLKSKKTCYASATYGLLRAGIVLKNEKILTGAKRNFDWVVSLQLNSGWIEDWGFEGDWAVLHRIAYTLRGTIEAYLYFRDEKYLNCTIKGIDFLMSFDKTKSSYADMLPSYLHKSGDFRDELCVTGLSQMAIILSKIPEQYQKRSYKELFENIISGTKKLQPRGFDNQCMNGVMPASYPLSGKYQSYDLIEWGTKYFMDSLLIKKGILAEEIRG